MLPQFRPWQATLLILIVILLTWLGNGISRPAAADPRLEARLNRLDSDLGRLRSQVNRIESQLSIPPRSAPSPPLPRPVPAEPIEPSLVEQFDNLATLAVETKLQLRQLEDRVTRLEQAIATESPSSS